MSAEAEIEKPFIGDEEKNEIAEHLEDSDQTNRRQQTLNAGTKGKLVLGQTSGAANVAILPTLNGDAERKKQKKKKVDEAVRDIWNTMTFLVLSETGILTALYNIPDGAKCRYWWLLLVLIIPTSVICTIRLSLNFRLLYKEKKERTEEEDEDVALWLTASRWRLIAFFACMVVTILTNTAFLSAGAKLIPCWVKT